MIVPMQKVSVLCMDADREAAVAGLRRLGVLHVTPVQPSETEDLRHARRCLERARHACDVLEAFAHHHHGNVPPGFSPPRTADDVVAWVEDAEARQRKLVADADALRIEERRLAPFGNFSPEHIRELQDAGLTVHLCAIGRKQDVSIPDSVLVTELSEDGSNRYVALIADRPFEIEADCLPLPERSLNEVRRSLADIRDALDAIEGELVLLAPHRGHVSECVRKLTRKACYLEARDGMGEAGRIAYIEGFCPEDRISEVSAAAAANGWGLYTRAPEPGEDVPTLIRTPRWVRPIKAVFDMIEILPGYHETDISAVFLLFFSIFFAMLIGDAGYGVLFLLLTCLARRKWRKAPAYPFQLFGILSVVTIVWGLLTGNVFGITALPGLIEGLQLSWLQDQANVMKLCFFIGAVHLSIAHLWNALILYPSPRSIAQLGWVALVWTMFYTACNMVLQEAFPSWILYVFAGGLIAITGFMTAAKDLKTEWIQHAMLPLSVVSCFVDVVSYIRLFAVGMASLSVAASFNDMAAQIGFDRIWTVPVAALILLAGHGLNILLCALGVLVHGVRLNTLEFSLHKNMEWSGIPYVPFGENMQGEET